MNSIEAHYNNSAWGYDHFILNHGSAALLATLRAGLRYEELVQERALPFDDWRKGKWSAAWPLTQAKRQRQAIRPGPVVRDTRSANR